MGDLVRRTGFPSWSRRSWLRAARVKRVQLLGERLIVFRGKSGRAGLVAEFCPHRSASLFYGRVEDAGMRCAYHGWKFGLDGQCERDAERAARVGLRVEGEDQRLPVRGGGRRSSSRTWARESTPPPLPELEWTLLPEGHTFTSRRVQDCNWFRPSRAGSTRATSRSSTRRSTTGNSEVTQDMDRVSFGVGAAVSTGDRAPRFEVVDTDYGVLIGARRANPDGRLVLAGSPSSSCRSTRCRPPISTSASCSRTSGCRWTTPTW